MPTLESLLAAAQSSLDRAQSELRRTSAVGSRPALELARTLYEARRRREALLPASLFGEPAWDMLLHLFIAHQEWAELTTTALCEAAHVPETTALRWIGRLEEAGLAERGAAEHDRRLTIVSLTADGLDRMLALLEQIGGRG